MFAWAVVVLYGLMVLPSCGIAKWQVFGRTARTLLPFLCIAAAGGWQRISRESDRLLNGRAWLFRAALAAAALVQVAFNFAPVLAQRFPAEINREIARVSTFAAMNSVGSCQDRQPAVPQAALILMNSTYLWPVECFSVEPRGRIVYQTRHPFQYEPYLYESYAPQQRSLLRRADISIRLLEP